MRASKWIVGGAAAAVLATSAGASAFAAEVTLRCAHDQPDTGFYEVIWQTFKAIVERNCSPCWFSGCW